MVSYEPYVAPSHYKNDCYFIVIEWYTIVIRLNPDVAVTWMRWVKRLLNASAGYVLPINIKISWNTPDSKVRGANMGPTRVLSAPGGPHVGLINLAIRDVTWTLADQFRHLAVIAKKASTYPITLVKSCDSFGEPTQGPRLI